MDKFWATFSLTYKSKVKTKSFMIFTAIVVVLMLAAANINKIVDLFDNGPDKIGIVVNQDSIYKGVKAQSDHLDSDAKFKKMTESQAHQQVKNESLDKAYVIQLHDNHKLTGEILSKDTVSKTDEQKLQTTLSTIQTKLVASSLNLSEDELKQLQSQSEVSSQVLSDSANGTHLSESQKTFNTIIVYAGIMLMFFIIINYANQVAMEIATEKTSRVIEMIITSISPVTHILAKLCGVIAVALTQISIFIVVGIISVLLFDIGDMLKGFDVQPNDLTVQLIIVGILSLILGILSYIILAAILGSITSRIEDINQSLMPMTLISIIALYTAMFGVINPDTTIIRITSFIPLLSPFIMFLRASTPDVATWEIVISMSLSIVTIFILLYIAVRSYKDTILSFDKGLFKSMKRVFGKN